METDQREPPTTSSSSTNITRIISTYLQNSIFWTFPLGLNFQMVHMHIRTLCFITQMVMVYIIERLHNHRFNTAFCILHISSGYCFQYSVLSV